MSKAPEPGIVLTSGPKGRAAAALIKELVEALAEAEPLVETLHSITGAKDTRAIVWRALTKVRTALSRAGANR